MAKSRGSLRKKFIFSVGSLLLLAFLLFSFISYQAVSKRIRQNVTDGAISFSELATKPLVENYDMYFDSGYLKYYENYENIRDRAEYIKKIQILNVDGTIVFDSDNANAENYASNNSSVNDKLKEQLSSFDRYISYTDKDNHFINLIIQPYITEWGSHPYSIIYYVNYSQIDALQKSLVIETVIFALIFLIITGFLISFFTEKTILSPIAKITQVANSVAKGEFSVEQKFTQNDEIGKLSLDMNKITAELRKNIIELKELDKLKSSFTDLIARNLRSPVAHIKLDMKYINEKMGARLNIKETAVLEDIEKSNNQLQLLVEDLLNISSLKSGQVTRLIPEPINLVEMLKSVLRELKPEIDEKNIFIKFNTTLNKAETIADASKIRQTIMNIIDNAVKYNDKESGRIIIELIKQNNDYLITVEDNGNGISEEDQKNLFKPFNQGASQDKFSEGTGLGLYLSKLILEAHKGKITLKSQKEEGTTVNIWIPIKN